MSIIVNRMVKVGVEGLSLAGVAASVSKKGPGSARVGEDRPGWARIGQGRLL